ncbi:GLUG motif-containing protein, partial [Acinetobacter baumannii]
QSDRDGNFVGGLVGMNGDNLRTVSGVRYPGGNISNSFATGNVTASGSPTGGLVGYNAGSITASWASGNVWVRGNGGDITNAAS